MKTSSKAMIATAALGVVIWAATAQEAGKAPPGGERPPYGDAPAPGRPPGDFPRPQASPIVAALDANGDSIIDASEIAKASAALKKVDKNGDGQLTPDEYRPQGGPGYRRNGPRPDGPPLGDAPGQPRRPAPQRPPCQ